MLKKYTLGAFIIYFINLMIIMGILFTHKITQSWKLLENIFLGKNIFKAAFFKTTFYHNHLTTTSLKTPFQTHLFKNTNQSIKFYPCPS